uniref:Uncharacterized protein n=1 Tax=Mycena chlorophos TaxID=658473 RepID=A0ABQ0LR48_MYCCL|nr:predicted protein [Mycena chlorophos]
MTLPPARRASCFRPRRSAKISTGNRQIPVLPSSRNAFYRRIPPSKKYRQETAHKYCIQIKIPPIETDRLQQP